MWGKNEDCKTKEQAGAHLCAFMCIRVYSQVYAKEVT